MLIELIEALKGLNLTYIRLSSYLSFIICVYPNELGNAKFTDNFAEASLGDLTKKYIFSNIEDTLYYGRKPSFYSLVANHGRFKGYEI